MRRLHGHHWPRAGFEVTRPRLALRALCWAEGGALPGAWRDLATTPPRMSSSPLVRAWFSLPRKGLGPRVLLGPESQRGPRCLACQQLTPCSLSTSPDKDRKQTKEKAVVGYLAR